MSVIELDVTPNDDQAVSDQSAAELQEVDRLDRLATRVAELMPFAVELEADMYAGEDTYPLQIMLGSRGDVDDPADRAGIDPGKDETWWIENGMAYMGEEHGGERVVSTFTRDTDPAVVADWIAQEAKRMGSPAAVAATDVAAMGFSASPVSAAGGTRTSVATPTTDATVAVDLER